MKGSTLGWIVAVVIIILAALYIGERAPLSQPVAPVTGLNTETKAQSSSSVTAPTVSAKQTAPLSAPQNPGKVVHVSITKDSFEGRFITIAKGTTVIWTNNDSGIHTVTSLPGGPNSGYLKQGMTYSFTFNQVGTISYRCNIHPGMSGTVYVTE